MTPIACGYGRRTSTYTFCLEAEAMTSQITDSRKNSKAKNGKPSLPKNYPLWIHPSGRFCKKIRGKAHYFGKVDDGWQAALDRFLEVKDDLLAGRTPRVKSDSLTIRDLCNRFLTAKQHDYENGEIVYSTFVDYKKATDRLVSMFGLNRLVDDLAADDFEQLRNVIAKGIGPTRLSSEIGRTRVVFNFAFNNHLIDKPVRYGSSFNKPSKKVLRKHKAQQGKKLFTASEIRSMVDVASPQLKAMVLLGINCAFGNSDCGTLPMHAVDLDNGWIDYARPKTGIERRCPLWKETVDSIRTAIAERPSDEFVFVTKNGDTWAKKMSKNPISAEMRRLLDKLGIHRKGVGFYSLRHTHRTIADATRDFPAARLIMGHADESIDAVYREEISDERLQSVAAFVHTWLFGGTANA